MIFNIKAMGLITSVGRDYETSCSSIRAGISRFSDLNHVETLNLDQIESDKAVGSPVAGITDGYSGYSRWFKMLKYAIDDAKQSFTWFNEQENESWETCGVYILLPDLANERYLYDPVTDADSFKKMFLDRLLEYIHPSLKFENSQIFIEGNTGLAASLFFTDEFISKRKISNIIILSVDSFIDASSINWILKQNRLKNDEQKNGMIPGEAASLLLIDFNNEGRALGKINDVSIESTGVEDIITERDNGNTLAECIRKTIDDRDFFFGDIYNDNSGEIWKSHEYWMAKTLLQSGLHDDCREFQVAESLGDTGAASASIAVISAIQSFEYNYSKTNEALVISQSDEGNFGSFIISREK